MYSVTCVLDTLGPIMSVLNYFPYDEGPFGTVTMCVDYAGTIIIPRDRKVS